MCISAALLAGLLQFSFAATTNRPVQVQTEYIGFTLDPESGGVITSLSLNGSGHNLAGKGGLLQEGFGVASRFDPNRRFQTQLDVTGDDAGRTALTFRYACDGLNIQGLIVTRTVEPIPDEATLRVTWHIENQGQQSQWVVPWIRNNVAPGGSVGSEDHFDVPTPKGIERVRETRFALAARNWIAATDAEAKETLYTVFDAGQIHSFQTIVEPKANEMAFKAYFVPFTLNPGEHWNTAFRISVIRGLDRVDFASVELAAKISVLPETIRLLMSAPRVIESTEIRAVVYGVKGEAISLPAKRFAIAPNRLAQCTYPWNERRTGAYRFRARLSRDRIEVPLGTDMHAPYTGIETAFTVGDLPPEPLTPEPLTPWTNAPFALQRGVRRLERSMAIDGATKVWFESSLEKIFPEDEPVPTGRIESAYTLALARNESESFQIVLRPPKGRDLRVSGLDVSNLVDRETGRSLNAGHVQAYRVAYVPVQIPTHFENPTGLYPDPLPPMEAFTAKGGESSPIWFTVFAPLGTHAGNYEGNIVIYADERPAFRLGLRVTVLDFSLPSIPSLRTDFGFSPERAVRSAQSLGTEIDPAGLLENYLANASRHRVTLRSLTQFPQWSPRYSSALAEFEKRLPKLLESGPSSIVVPASLADVPEDLRKVDEIVARNNLKSLVFAPIRPRAKDRNSRTSWTARIASWRELAPNIPVMLTAPGREWSFPGSANLLSAHARVVETASRKQLSAATYIGKELWWFIDDEPRRPYPNFFVDFSAIEHRALFWLSWHYGIQGLRYEGINLGHDKPYEGLLDATPANGNAFLVYPGSNGPVNSIRWEIIRDGIEDFDYLTLLKNGLKNLSDSKAHPELIERGRELLDVSEIATTLGEFSRDSALILQRRARIGRLIEEIEKVTEH